MERGHTLGESIPGVKVISIYYNTRKRTWFELKSLYSIGCTCLTGKETMYTLAYLLCTKTLLTIKQLTQVWLLSNVKPGDETM